MSTTLRLLTSSWRAEIDTGQYTLIAISRSVPRGRRGFRRFAALQPGPWFRSIPDEREWARRYEAEVIGPLDPEKVVDDLAALAGDRPAVLLCWEAPPPDPLWCHRSLVSLWLHRELGLDVPELGHEELGFGDRHPKLPPSLLATG